MTTPNARVILPAEATGELLKAARKHLPGGHGQVWVYLPEAYESMLAASPTSGKVTEAEVANMLAAKPFEDGDETVEHIIIMGLAACGFKLPSTAAPDVIRAALSALGLEVE